MHASLAFVNGAGQKRGATAATAVPGDLRLLNALLSTATGNSSVPQKGESNEESQSEERPADEDAANKSVSKPGGFHNDPDDPANPNEARERHLKKIKQ